MVLQTVATWPWTDKPLQTESLFHTYARFAAKADVDPKPSEEEQKTEEQLNEVLEKVSHANQTIFDKIPN